MKTCLTFVAGTLLLVAAACGDTNADSRVAAEDLTVEQLGLMVLPQEAFGAEGATLALDDDSGPQGAPSLADDTLDPDDTDADVVAAGWQRGYDLEFNNPDLLASTDVGVYGVSSSVLVFDDADAASAFAEKEIADGDRLEGEELSGFKLVNFLSYGVPEHGDESWGFTVALQIGDQLVYGTVTLIREGPLLASTGITTTGSGDLRPLVEMWAEELETRMEGVLDGTLTEEG